MSAADGTNLLSKSWRRPGGHLDHGMLKVLNQLSLCSGTDVAGAEWNAMDCCVRSHTDEDDEWDSEIAGRSSTGTRCVEVVAVDTFPAPLQASTTEY